MTPVQSFIIELLNRIRTKSPAFFRAMSFIMLGFIAIGFIPYVMKFWLQMEDISSGLVAFCKDVSKIATGFFLCAGLAKKDAPVAQTIEGQAVTVTDEKKFPFSDKAEKKKIDEEVPPPPVVDVPDNKP